MSNTKILLSALFLLAGAIAAPLNATVYKANSVMMNTGAGSGTDMYFSLLGETKDGYQIWSGNNTSGSHRWTYWKIDGGDRISCSYTNINTNTKYYLDTGYSQYFRDIESDSKYYHFLKVLSQTSADFFYWNMSSTPSFAPEFYVTANVAYSIGSYEFVSKDRCYKQQVNFNVEGITKTMFDHCIVEYSTDSTSWVEAAQVDSMSGTVQAKIPWTATKVRYRVTAYPKSSYKVVVENGCWSAADSTDRELKPTGVDYKFNVSNLKGRCETDQFGNKLYMPTVSYSCSDNIKNAFSTGRIQLSIDGGETWVPVMRDLSSSEGSFTTSVLAGYTRYMFRIYWESVSGAQNIKELNPMALIDTCLTYSPAFVVAQLNSEIDEGKDQIHKTLSPTVQFMLNDDLYMTCRGNAVISMSSDDGATWTELSQVAVNKKICTAQVTIPADRTQYKFRIQLKSVVDEDRKTATEQIVSVETPNYLYTPDIPTGVDDATVGTSNALVDVYTLSGKLVAKQMRASDVNSILENGTYVVGNKVVIVNKSAK